jgi:hypothetical protein
MTPPWTSLWRLLAPDLLGDGVRMVRLGALALFIPLAVSCVRHLRVSYSTYVVMGVLMPLSVSNLLGLPRYLMVLFPAFMMLARWGRSRTVHLAIVVGFCLLLPALMMTWMQWRHSF